MSSNTTGPERARILIADSAELMRRGIREVFNRDRRFVVVGEVAQAQEVAQASLQLTADVILLGLWPGHSGDSEVPAGVAAIQETLRVAPFVRVIALVAGDTVEDLLEPAQAGIKGVLLRDASASTLLEAVRDVLAGGAALDPRLTRSLFDYLAAGASLPPADVPEARLDPAVLHVLSPREQEVLLSLAQGCRNKEIAAQLGVSVGTVKTHLRHIFRKLEVDDRTAAVLTALQVRLPEIA